MADATDGAITTGETSASIHEADVALVDGILAAGETAAHGVADLVGGAIATGETAAALHEADAAFAEAVLTQGEHAAHGVSALVDGALAAGGRAAASRAATHAAAGSLVAGAMEVAGDRVRARHGLYAAIAAASQRAGVRRACAARFTQAYAAEAVCAALYEATRVEAYRDETAAHAARKHTVAYSEAREAARAAEHVFNIFPSSIFRRLYTTGILTCDR